MNEQVYTGTNNMQPNNQIPNQNQGGGLARFLLGIFTGVTVAAPVTALIVKNICEKDKNKAVEEAENRGIQAGIAVAVEETKKQAGSDSRAVSEANRGISEGNPERNEGWTEGVSGNATASEAKEPEQPAVPVYLEGQQVGQYTSNGMEFNTTTFIPVPVETRKDKNHDEAYLASLQSPPDDSGIDDDLENYDLTIDDEEASQDAAEFSEQRVKYLDMMEKYRNRGGGIPPMTITREQFENEHFHEKSYVNYYPDDDTFAEDDQVIQDPGYTFGFQSGKDMFAPERTAVREDPDICHVRNFSCSTDFEITRMQGSFNEMVRNGMAYYTP